MSIGVYPNSNIKTRRVVATRAAFEPQHGYDMLRITDQSHRTTPHHPLRNPSSSRWHRTTMARRLYPWILGGVLIVGLIIAVTVTVVIVRSNRKATLRLNCGGPKLENSVLADNTTFTEHTNGTVMTQRDSKWETDLYRSNAYVPNGKDLVYTFQVTNNSRVEVTARFVELWEGASKPNARLLRVIINGKIVADELDIFRTVGGLRKRYDASHRFTASNGAVEVRIRPLVQNAIIAGIDVIASGRVIAGGPLAELPNSTTDNNATNTANSTNPSNSTNPGSTPTPVTTIPADPSPPSTPNSPVTPPSPPTPNTPKLVASGRWRTVALKSGSPKPARRHESCAVMNNGLMYIIGGRGRRPVSVYDPKMRVWTNKREPPVELNHMQCVSVGTNIYVVGAWFGSFPRETAHADTYVYDTTTDSWSTAPGLPAARNRGGGATVVYNGLIYLAMGNQGGHGAHATSVGMFDVYDPKTRTWRALSDAPNPRDHVGGAVVGGKLCIAGGRDGGVANFWGTPVTKVNCYDFASGKWEVGPDLPDGRAGAAIAALCDGEHILIAGGEGRAAGTTAGGKAYDRVDLYSVKEKVFRAPGKLIRGRHGSGLAVADCACGNVYLPSGSGGLGGSPELDDTEVWSPDGIVRDC